MAVEPGQGGGLFNSLRRLGRTVLEAARVRVELVASEVEEQGLRLSQLLLLAVAAGFCIALAIVLLIEFFVVLFWDTHRLAALGFFALCFATAGALLLLALRARARSRPRFLAATVAELNKDRQRTGDGE